MDNKTLAQIIQNNVRIKNLEQSGGEVWDDITNLFTVGSTNKYYYNISNSILSSIIKNIPIRITIELCTIDESTDIITGTTQVYVTKGTEISVMRISTNTICSSVEESVIFTGYLFITNTIISYQYGVSIEKETARPKILKVERLI